MELRHLQHFLAILEAGSLGRAAKVLNISEPALSKSIRRLEDSLQVKLLDRSPLGMTPTVFGNSLAVHARLVQSELEHALNDLDELRGVSRGVVHIGAGPSFANSFLPEAVARFRAVRPGVRVVVKQGLTDLLPELIMGDLDILFVNLQEDAEDPLLEQEHLMDDRVTVVARHGHPLSRKRSLSITDLTDAYWVLPPKPDPVRRRFDGLMKHPDVEPVQVAAESSSIIFLTSFVRQTDALCFLPEHLVGQDLKLKQMTLLNVGGVEWRRRLGLVRRRRSSMSPATRALIDELKSVCAEAAARTNT